MSSHWSYRECHDSETVAGGTPDDEPEPTSWETWRSVLRTIAGDDYGKCTEAEWRECFDAGWLPVEAYREFLDAETNPIPIDPTPCP